MSSNRLQKLLEFIGNEPNDPFLKYALATEYLAVNDTLNALMYFEDLLSNHQDYVGTYYHLGKLYEALQRKEDAIKVYEAGMKIARTVRDNHAYTELQAVYNSAMGLDYEDD
jgi:tetratricopeptide (TPR) repeat protein